MTMNNTTIHVLPLGFSLSIQTHSFYSHQNSNQVWEHDKKFGTGNKLLLMFPVKAAKLQQSCSSGSHKLVLNSIIMEIDLSNDGCLSLVVKV